MLLITKVSPNWNNDWMNYLNEMERHSVLQSLCGLAGTHNPAVCLEQATAEGGTATGGSRPTAAIGKFSRRSEDTKLPTFRLAVVHLNVHSVYPRLWVISTLRNAINFSVLILMERRTDI